MPSATRPARYTLIDALLVMSDDSANGERARAGFAALGLPNRLIESVRTGGRLWDVDGLEEAFATAIDGIEDRRAAVREWCVATGPGPLGTVSARRAMAAGVDPDVVALLVAALAQHVHVAGGDAVVGYGGPNSRLGLLDIRLPGGVTWEITAAGGESATVPPLPDTVAQGLVGRPLTDVFVHPVIDGDAFVVRAVGRTPIGTRIRFDAAE